MDGVTECNIEKFEQIENLLRRYGGVPMDLQTAASRLFFNILHGARYKAVLRCSDYLKRRI